MTWTGDENTKHDETMFLEFLIVPISYIKKSISYE